MREAATCPGPAWLQELPLPSGLSYSDHSYNIAIVCHDYGLDLAAILTIYLYNWTAAGTAFLCPADQQGWNYQPVF